MATANPETLFPLMNTEGKPYQHGSRMMVDSLTNGLPIQNGLADKIHRELVEPLRRLVGVWGQATFQDEAFTYSLEEYPLDTPLVLGFPGQLRSWYNPRGESGCIKLGRVVGILPLKEFGAAGFAIAAFNDIKEELNNNPQTIGMIFGAR